MYDKVSIHASSHPMSDLLRMLSLVSSLFSLMETSMKKWMKVKKQRERNESMQGQILKLMHPFDSLLLVIHILVIVSIDDGLR